jgi:hypothetical protein
VAARPLLAVTLMVTMAHGTRAPLRGDRIRLIAVERGRELADPVRLGRHSGRQSAPLRVALRPVGGPSCAADEVR